MPKPRRSAFDGASRHAAAEAAAALSIDPRRVIIAADGKGDGRPFVRLLETPGPSPAPRP